MAAIPTVNEKLLRRYVRHAVYLEQLKKGEARAISSFLKQETFPQLYKKLIMELGKVKDLSKAGFKIKRLKKMLAATHKISVAGAVKAEKMLVNRLVNISKFEAKFNADLISKTVPIDIEMTMPSNEVLRNLVTQRPFEGHKLSTWMSGYSKSVTAAMGKAVKVGVATGESLPAIAKRLEKALGYKTKQAEFIARTAVSSVVHNAKEEVFKRNTDIIRKVQWVSTLDNRTSLICINYDGKIFDVGHGMRPPAHFNCRSTVVPLTPSWQEFGVVDPPPATRASMNGAVPAKMNYRQWIKTQPKAVQVKVLGKKRAELYRSGQVKIDRFVDKNMKPLNLKQLARREGLKEDFLPAPPQVEAIPVKGTGVKLLQTEKDAFYSYGAGAYRQMNASQLGRPWSIYGWDEAKMVRSINSIESGMAKLSAHKGITYRGLAFDTTIKRTAFLEKFKVGEIWKSKTFQSSSISKDIAKRFSDIKFDIKTLRERKAKGVIFHMDGRSGRNITKLTKAGEQEVLFKAGTPFKVTRIKGNEIWLEEITKQAQLKAVPAPPTVKAMSVKGTGKILTAVEKDALNSYTGIEYDSVNLFLRGKVRAAVEVGTSKARIIRTIESMNSGLKKLPGFSGTTHRGLAFQTEVGRQKFLANFSKGGVWKSKSFQSTTPSQRIAKRFAKSKGYRSKSVTLHIDGVSGRNISPYSDIQFVAGDEEILFRAGTPFKVVKIKGNEIWLEEITKQAQLKAVPAPPTVTKVGATFTKTTSKEFNDLVTKQIDAYPENVKVALNKRGITYKAGNKTTEMFPELKGKHPRGWPAGTNWDSVSGTYHTSTKEIALSEQYRPIRQKTFITTSKKEIKGILNHETGHGFDASPEGLFYSSTDKFKAAYAKDFGAMTRNEMRERGLQYYHQAGVRGRSETFAEVFANIMGQGAQPGNINISKWFPNSKKYIESILKVKPISIAKAKVTVVPKVKIKIIPAPPATGLLGNRLANPKVQSLIEKYAHDYRIKNKIGMRTAKGKLALKGIWIDKTGSLTTKVAARSGRLDFPKLKTGELIIKKTPIVPKAVNKQKAWEAGLSTKEKEAVKYWSGDVYAVKHVRDFQAGRLADIPKEVLEKAKLFDKVIKKAPNYTGTVYRGQGLDAGAKSLKVGSRHTFKEAVSSSKSFDVAEEFASYAPTDDIILYEIRTKTAKDISKLIMGEYEDQLEMFISKGSSFRILEKKFVKSALMDNKTGGYWRVMLEEI